MQSERKHKCFLLFYQSDNPDPVAYLNEDVGHILTGDVVETRKKAMEKLMTTPVMLPFTVKLNIDASEARKLKQAADVNHLLQSVKTINNLHVELDHDHFHATRSKKLL